MPLVSGGIEASLSCSSVGVENDVGPVGADWAASTLAPVRAVRLMSRINTNANVLTGDELVIFLTRSPAVQKPVATKIGQAAASSRKGIWQIS